MHLLLISYIMFNQRELLEDALIDRALDYICEYELETDFPDMDINDGTGESVCDEDLPW